MDKCVPFEVARPRQREQVGRKEKVDDGDHERAASKQEGRVGEQRSPNEETEGQLCLIDTDGIFQHGRLGTHRRYAGAKSFSLSCCSEILHTT